MISLDFASFQEVNVIKKINGTQEVKEHLQQLGFRVGCRVAIISSTGTDFIISVNDKRIAISKALAKNVLI